MESVLVGASVTTGGTIKQSHWYGLQVRATSIERSNFAMTQSTTADTSRKVDGYSVSTLQIMLSSSQVEMLCPLRISSNSKNIFQKFHVPKDLLQNYEIIDGSVADTNEDQLDGDFTKVAHTRESFSQFLHQFPANELKDVAQACDLSNLAYIIRELKEDKLYKDHKLRLVTSSVHRDSSGATEQFGIPLAPATAYALAAAASYLKSSDSSTRSRKCSGSLPSELLSRAVDQNISSTMSSLMTDTGEPCRRSLEPITVESNREEASTSNPASACGWFACDDLTTATRFFSIQGSESVASWKANLQFQPTQFEGPRTGVMVHKGVYEIAKSLYNQMLPLVQSHMAAYGMRARISFTGHSLGGSIAVLLSLMFRYRGVVPVSALRQVYTFGAPSVMNGGNNFLKRLNFPLSHIQSVVISRDLVPRIFACDIPEQIVEVLKRLNKSFRSLPTYQRQLYYMTGRLVILQPEAQHAPGHPLLPSGSGIYILDQAAIAKSQDLHHTKVSKEKELRAAESSFLNSPHPLDIMSDPSAYGPEGAISRDHDPRSYRRAVNQILKQTASSLHQWKRLEICHFKVEMAKFAAEKWPPSPVGTPNRYERIKGSSVLCFNKNESLAPPQSLDCATILAWDSGRCSTQPSRGDLASLATRDTIVSGFDKL